MHFCASYRSRLMMFTERRKASARPICKSAQMDASPSQSGLDRGLCPDGAIRARSHAGLDEGKAAYSVLHGRKIRREGLGLAAVLFRPDLFGGIRIEVCEAFDVAFGMTGR